MAVAPTSANFERATPQPASGVATYRPQQQGNEGAQALYEEGQQNRELAAYVEKFGDELAHTSAQDALNKLREKRNELTYDPERGFLRIKGGDVLKTGPGGKPWIQEMPDTFKAAADEIGGKLLSPLSRKLFREAAEKEQSSYKTALASHMVGESEKYQAAVHKDTQTALISEAAQSYNDPDKLQQIAERAAMAEDNWSKISGMPSKAAAARSNVLRIGVESLLASGANRQALAYYDGIKDKLDGPDAVAMASRLKATGTGLRGEQAANEALVALGLPGISTTDGSILNYRQKVQTAESPDGRSNPDSGAGGFFQFIDSTWLTYARKALPVSGKSDAEILALRGNRQAQEVVFEAFTADNEAKLQKAGLPVTDTTRYLAHWFGDAGAVRLLTADKSKPIEEFLPPGKTPTNKTWAEANGIAGKTVGQVINIAGSRMGETARVAFPSPGLPQSTDGAPLFKGDTKSAYQQASLSVMNRTDLSPEEKTQALALLNKQQTQLTGFQTAAVAGLRDEANTTLAMAFVNPESFKSGTFQAFADRAASLGQQELSTRYRLFASMEGTLREGLQSARPDQLRLLKELSDGLPKSLLEAYQGGNADLAHKGETAFSRLKQAQKDGLGTEGLTTIAMEAAQHFADAGKGTKAQEVRDWLVQATIAEDIVKQPPEARRDRIAELEDIVAKGKATEQHLALHHMVKEGITRQETAIKADALLNGASIYGLGPLPPLDFTKAETLSQSLAVRGGMADRINANFPGADAGPLTNEEITRTRDFLAKADIGGAIGFFKALSALPDAHVNRVAAQLAGKGKGDPLSMMYASALSLYRKGDPVADEVLRGAEVLKTQKPAMTDKEIQRQAQEHLGNALQLFGTTEVPAEIVQAAKATYAWRQSQAGKIDTFDPDAFDKALQAVTGGTFTYRGQKIIAPRPGATPYDVDAALNQIGPQDLPDGLATVDGTAITADMVKRRGVLVSAGDGSYVVKIPDPRAGGDLRPIRDPRTGTAWVLGLVPLLDRQAANPVPPDQGAAAARRRAPASPTAGLE